METKEIIIKPQAKWSLIDLGELWRYRELLYIFSWRDIKVRYKQTLFGLAWAILQPLATMVIFTVFFGNLAKIPSGKLPYPLFVLCGLVFWTFFSNTLTNAANSMVSHENIIKKVYFPKITLPLSTVLTGIVDFVINFIILIIFALILGFIPSIWILLALPVSVLLTIMTSLGLGAFLAAFNVRYRDVRYVLPFFIQILLFVTPVIYPLSLIPTQKRYLMALNPMTLVVESVRSAFTGENLLCSGSCPLNFETAAISIVSAFVILFLGLWYFRKTERFFADIV
ncbi:MAG: ABC transporter permease [Patescibacteria group bacterium]|nr:ABC transporter permease [Patescibacteria group bacterium]